MEKGENAKILFCLFAYKLAVKLSFFFSFSLEWLCSFFLLLLTEWAAGRTQKEKLFLSSFDLPALPLNSWLIHAFGNACLLWTGGGLKAAAAGSIEGVSTWPQQQQQGCTCTRTLNAAAALMFGRFTDVEGKKKPPAIYPSSTIYPATRSFGHQRVYYVCVCIRKTFLCPFMGFKGERAREKRP